MNTNMTWKQLLSVQVGGAICLPILLIGQVAGQTGGLFGGLLSILIGNALLAGIALIAANLSVTYRESTCETARRFLGNRGTQLFALLLSFSMLAWFAIQLDLISVGISQGLQETGLTLHRSFLNVTLGAAMTLCTIGGIRSITRFSSLAMPLMGLVLAYAAYLGIQGLPEAVDRVEISLSPLGLILAACMGGVVDLPTFFRHAKSGRDARIASLVLFLLVVPGLESIGVLLGVAYPEGDLIQNLSMGTFPGLGLLMTLFVCIAGWTTNNANLYSAIAGMETLFKRSSLKQRALLGGGLGILMALAGALEHFESFLELIGVCISSVGGVILCNYQLGLKRSPAAVGLTLLCITIALTGLLSGIAVVDAFLCCVVGSLIIRINKTNQEKMECEQLTVKI